MRLKNDQYDFIIRGAGCAGLSLLMRMLRSTPFSKKKILLIDKEQKTRNDRTWCFWEKGKGFFEDIVYKRWPSIEFKSDDYEKVFDIAPYQYKMIRGIDFYEYCFGEIQKHSNVEIFYGDANEISNGEAVVFNSIYKHEAHNGDLTIWQHFKGWIIDTKQARFNPNIATIMDFRVHQQHGTSFAYVLPFCENKALVEFTLFTKDLLQQEQYDSALKTYIRDFLHIETYDILEEEFGAIPMTDRKFPFNHDGMYHIGTAGGQTKASSGYTFQFIQKQSQQIVDQFPGNIQSTPKRFGFYDRVLLHILYHNSLPGKKIFTDLFSKNDPQKVLRFLDNESRPAEELKIISTLPTLPFLKAALGL